MASQAAWSRFRERSRPGLRCRQAIYHLDFLPLLHNTKCDSAIQGSSCTPTSSLLTPSNLQRTLSTHTHTHTHTHTYTHTHTHTHTHTRTGDVADAQPGLFARDVAVAPPPRMARRRVMMIGGRETSRSCPRRRNTRWAYPRTSWPSSVGAGVQDQADALWDAPQVHYAPAYGPHRDGHVVEQPGAANERS